MIKPPLQYFVTEMAVQQHFEEYFSQRFELLYWSALSRNYKLLLLALIMKVTLFYKVIGYNIESSIYGV